mmetsp:Transcript_63918/g.138956  ORF Transcript_63918/g.138956 Transcript_63918/m.138956 type:complete len:271 (-) Transcript_63918:433-1245(-)
MEPSTIVLRRDCGCRWAFRSSCPERPSNFRPLARGWAFGQSGSSPHLRTSLGQNGGQNPSRFAAAPASWRCCEGCSPRHVGGVCGLTQKEGGHHHPRPPEPRQDHQGSRGGRRVRCRWHLSVRHPAHQEEEKGGSLLLCLRLELLALPQKLLRQSCPDRPGPILCYPRRHRRLPPLHQQLSPGPGPRPPRQRFLAFPAVAAAVLQASPLPRGIAPLLPHPSLALKRRFRPSFPDFLALRRRHPGRGLESPGRGNARVLLAVMLVCLLLRA